MGLKIPSGYVYNSMPLNLGYFPYSGLSSARKSSPYAQNSCASSPVRSLCSVTRLRRALPSLSKWGRPYDNIASQKAPEKRQLCWGAVCK